MQEGAKIAGYTCGIVIIAFSADPWTYAYYRLVETMLGIGVAWAISMVPKVGGSRNVPLGLLHHKDVTDPGSLRNPGSELFDGRGRKSEASQPAVTTDLSEGQFDPEHQGGIIVRIENIAGQTH